MRRPRMVTLAALLAMGLAAGVAAADSPFAGTWKATLPNQQFEVNVWLLKIDKEGKEVEVVAGLNRQFKAAKVSDVKGGEKSLGFSLVVPPGQPGAAPQGFNIALVPPKKDDKDTVLGTALVGSNVLPVWLEKTEQTEIDPMKASQVVGAFGDLEAALKKKGEERIKDLFEVTSSHAGRPVGVLAFNILLGELNKAKAGAKEYEKYGDAVAKGLAPFGPNMLIGRSVQLADVLRADKKLAPLALARSQAAVKLLSADTPLALRMGAQLSLAAALVANDKKDEADKVAPEARKLAEEVIARQKEDNGKLLATQAVARTFLGSPAAAVADLGLEYAQKTVKLVKKDAPLAQRAAANRLLLVALTQRGKKDTKEAKELAVEVEKMEVQLDAEFAKKNVAFEVKPFGKREGKSKRVVLVELFNTVNDPGSVAAESAFDAAGKGYGDKEVVLLQYQLAAGNPLANADSAARHKYYEDDVKQPGTAVLDGKAGPLIRGNTLKQAEARFEALGEALNKQLEVVEEAALKLDVKRDGEKLEMTAEVSGLKEPGPKLKLRFALVEELVRYQGNNGYRLHRNLVRALPGGAAGTALKTKDSTTKVELNLDDLRKVLLSHQKAFAAGAFVGPPELKKLKVVAFVQDDDSKRVLQAVQAAVPGK